jgi:hypothetical protein
MDRLSYMLLDLSKSSNTVRKFNVSVNDSKIKSYCLFPQSFSSVKIQIFLFCNDFRLTRIILRPLSALSLDEVNIAKRNITTGLFGLILDMSLFDIAIMQK